MHSISNQILQFKPFYQPSLIHDLFSWKELENLLNLRPFVNAQRFHILSGKQYEWGSSCWLSDVNTYPPSLIQEEIQNHVCYLSDCSRVNSQVNQLCQQLETLTAYPTDAHIYFSVEDIPTPGFGIHYDFSHNLIVQIEGQTHFKVWGERENEFTPTNVNEIQEDPILDVVMNAGDVIFIPIYYWHSAHSITKRLSISFPLSPHPYSLHQCRKWIELTNLCHSSKIKE